MTSLSAQALALFLVLSPGFVFFVGFGFAGRGTSIELQRGIIIDTAIFVLMSTILHSIVGYIYFFIVDRNLPCPLVKSLLKVSNIGDINVIQPCPYETIGLSILGYELALYISAFFLGYLVNYVVCKNPNLFRSIYGTYYSANSSIVIAAVMTNMTHNGQVLMYEGCLEELSLTAQKKINYICLSGASRFYMNLHKKGPHISSPGTLKRLDDGLDPNVLDNVKIRILIPGDSITNLVTRSYGVRNLAISTP